MDGPTPTRVEETRKPGNRQAAAGRRFGVADGMILVVATAIGLAASRAYAPDLKVIWVTVSPWPDEGPSISLFTEIFISLESFLILPWLASWTVACLLLQWRVARPPRRRIVRQPGMMACLVATVVIGLTVPVGLTVWVMTEPDNGLHLYRISRTLIFSSVHVGAAVAWCWVTMALGRQWRPEPTWLDRSGRILGSIWIAISITSIIHIYQTFCIHW
ncbi:hypothetical protein V5E97_26915 [Singulisphaera sp. Ch08]|uniref:DUF420 domain-containing protein n=1 Tax=Singulisphaera sp. Ch08 TaxID=3120278 RepID=A0AAU7C9P0_9BACT